MFNTATINAMTHTKKNSVKGLVKGPVKGLASTPKLSPLASAIKASLFGLALAQGTAHAATITVNNFGDAISNVNTCTLRQAIVSANTDDRSSSACAAGNGDDTINIQNAETATINLSAGALRISSNISIMGGGVTVNAASGSRILDINNSDGGRPIVSIDNMTLRGANAVNSYGAGIILNRGSTVTISNSTITDNTTNLLGGGVAVLGESTLNVVDSTISDNTVTQNDNPTNMF